MYYTICYHINSFSLLFTRNYFPADRPQVLHAPLRLPFGNVPSLPLWPVLHGLQGGRVQAGARPPSGTSLIEMFYSRPLL